jgi:hypothetical protein
MGNIPAWVLERAKREGEFIPGVVIAGQTDPECMEWQTCLWVRIPRKWWDEKGFPVLVHTFFHGRPHEAILSALQVCLPKWQAELTTQRVYAKGGDQSDLW